MVEAAAVATPAAEVADFKLVAAAAFRPQAEVTTMVDLAVIEHQVLHKVPVLILLHKAPNVIHL